MPKVTNRPLVAPEVLVDRTGVTEPTDGATRPMSTIIDETGRGFDHLMGVAKRWWLILVVGTLLGVGVAGLALGAAKTTYVANSIVLIDQPALTNDPGQGKVTVEKLGALMPTYTQLVTSDIVLDGVREQLGTTRSVSSLRDGITARQNADTLTLAIEVRADSEAEAAQISESVVAQFGARVSELGKGAVLPDAARLVIIPLQAAEVTPIAPRAGRTLVLAAVLGFGLAATAAFVLDRS